ncbi:hypothetical protein B0O80DRAFT_429775 [Mortierella sp. GBAus27b]|nr:hypothetical protein B0O80DRAFT_429775 [Mortierella sp. GBAus27b]
MNECLVWRLALPPCLSVRQCREFTLVETSELSRLPNPGGLESPDVQCPLLAGSTHPRRPEHCWTSGVLATHASWTFVFIWIAKTILASHPDPIVHVLHAAVQSLFSTYSLSNLN